MESGETINDRVWYAWHCLPRDKRGKPPSWKGLEKKYAISQATFSRLASGERKTVDLETLPRLAEALGVGVLWLLKGDGDRPKLTGPYRPRAERYEEFDPTAWGARVTAAGGVDAVITPSNPFQAAVQTLLLDVSEETITRVAEEAKGVESTRPAHHWGARLRTVEQEVRAARAARAASQTRARKRPRPTPGAKSEPAAKRVRRAS